MTQRFASGFYFSTDGLRLHYRDTGRNDEGRLPVVCLPGLTRASDDFEPLAEALAGASRPRRVIAFDYRGRGLSDHDSDWRHYDLATERGDLLRGLAHLGLASAHFVGTSRGGLHVLALEDVTPVVSVVFNDIGPVLEPEGLRRIRDYVGRPVSPRSFEEAIAVLKAGSGRHFDGLSSSEWRFFAETSFGRDGSRLGLRYDPQIARILDAFDLDKPLPDSWALFDRLKGRPILTIRGGNSDLLSEATLAAMATRWTGCEATSVAGQGHAPLLADAPTIARIERFLAAAD